MAGKLVFGLDLGINNVGWAVVRKEDAVEIKAVGVLAFESPLADENKPTEGLKTKVRGNFRRSRKTLRRRRWRKQELYRVLAEAGLLPTDRLERTTFLCSAPDPYELRAQALERRLEPFEVGKALCHLNQRRGFLSPRDLMLFGVARFGIDADGEASLEGKEDRDDLGVVAKQIEQTQAALRDYPTLGAYLHARLKEGRPVRRKTTNKEEKKPLSKSEQQQLDERRFVRFDRHMVRQEFDTIWEHQREHHPIMTDEFKRSVGGLIFTQRHLSADKSTRGRCPFFPKQLRAPRASLTAQKFAIAQEVAHLEVLLPTDERPRKLDAHERSLLVARLMEGNDLDWAGAKEELGLSPEAVFNQEPAGSQAKGKGKGKAATSKSGAKVGLKGSATVARIRGIIGDKWDSLGEQAQRELVGEIVSIRDWVGQVHDAPAAFRRLRLFREKAYGPNQVRFTEDEALRLATAPLPDGYLNLSLKAVKKILPHLLADKVYSEACAAAGLDHANPQGAPDLVDRLPFPSEEQIPHAVVRTSVRSAVRVLNTLRQEFGRPDAIHIELPRDLARGAKERKEIEIQQRARETERKQIVADLIAIRIRPNRANIEKVLLWKELGGAALPYEPDVFVSDLKELMNGDFQVDHIVPRGHNFDDGMANKTLCTRDFNARVKGARTPYEALASSPDWPRIRAHVMSLKSMPVHKRRRIVAKERPEDFVGRHLAATGWLSREVKKLAELMVERKQDVVVTPGRATSEFRKFWGLDGLVPLHPEEQQAEEAYKEVLKRAECGEATADEVSKARQAVGKARSNYLHHAVDALTVALADRAGLQALTEYCQLQEAGDPRFADREERKRLKASKMPDPELRKKAEAALEKAVVVHRPSRRAQGELHKQTADKRFVDGLPPGEPNTSRVVGKRLVRYDADGRAAQAYPLGNNHHFVIWESIQPDRKGVYRREAEVVPMIEAVRRKAAGEPVIRKTRPDPGWRFVMSLCKGDMVEVIRDDELVLARLSQFEQPDSGKVRLALWHPYVARQAGKINAKNPYLVAYTRDFSILRARVVLDPLGRVVYREGPRE